MICDNGGLFDVKVIITVVVDGHSFSKRLDIQKLCSQSPRYLWKLIIYDYGELLECHKVVNFDISITDTHVFYIITSVFSQNHWWKKNVLELWRTTNQKLVKGWLVTMEDYLNVTMYQLWLCYKSSKSQRALMYLTIFWNYGALLNWSHYFFWLLDP